MTPKIALKNDKCSHMLSMEKKSTKGLPGSSRDRTTDLEITGMMRYPIELSCQLMPMSSKFL